MIKLFKRKKTKRFLVYLGRRGNRRLLGSIELSENDDFVMKVEEFIDQRCKELKIDPSEYPRVHIVNAETGEELKTENPFYEPQESESPQSGGSSQVDPKELVQVALGLQGQIYKSVIEGVSESIKDVVKTSMSLGIDMINTLRAQTAQLLQQNINPKSEIDKMSLDDLLKMILLSSVAQGGLKFGQAQSGSS